MKAHGLLPTFDELFQRWIYNVIDQYSFELFVAISVVGAFAILFALNIINNLLEIIKLNFQQFYKRKEDKWIG